MCGLHVGLACLINKRKNVSLVSPLSFEEIQTSFAYTLISAEMINRILILMERIIAIE